MEDSASMNGVWSSLRALLIALGGALVTGGIITTTSKAYMMIMFASGAVLVIGPAIWGVYTSVMRVINNRKKVVTAMNATLNLVASGKALDASGSVIPYAVAGSTPPKAVTETSAPEIVKNFGTKVA